MKYNPKYNPQIHSMHDINKDDGHKELQNRSSFGSRYTLSFINEYAKDKISYYDDTNRKSWHSVSAFSERRRIISVYTQRQLKLCWFDYKFSQDEYDKYDDED